MDKDVEHAYEFGYRRGIKVSEEIKNFNDRRLERTKHKFLVTTIRDALDLYDEDGDQDDLISTLRAARRFIDED